MISHWSGQDHGLLFLKNMSAKGKRVVDVGCGNGWASLAMKEMGVDVTAMDINPVTYYKLVEVVAAGIPYIRTLEGSYDFVWCYHVLEHIENPIAFLVAMSALAPELWLAVPKFTEEGFAKGHINMYNMPVLIEHLRRGGWDVERGSYSVYPGPHIGSLWTVVRKQEGFVVGQEDTFSRYPEPMNELNSKSENHLRRAVFAWNWRW